MQLNPRQKQRQLIHLLVVHPSPGRVEEDEIAELLGDPNTHVYICGLRGMEEGVEKALTNIAESTGVEWISLRDAMREQGRYHVETY